LGGRIRAYSRFSRLAGSTHPHPRSWAGYFAADPKDLPRNNSPDSAAAGHCQRRCSAVEYGRILASRALLAAPIHTLGLGRGISRQTLSVEGCRRFSPMLLRFRCPFIQWRISEALITGRRTVGSVARVKTPKCIRHGCVVHHQWDRARPR
ncbi:MAG: hypothetical protein ACI9W2_003923, partial [Gammaproteobacteria bacterium]